MRSTILCVATVMGCATTQLPPPEPPPPQPKTPPGLELPGFEFHALDNGLRVALVENHAHPVIGLTAYVTTGGRTESAHYAGALHFIEHLVFKGGTRRFPPTAFRKRIAALGDESGGWTWDDEIQFGFEVPKKNFAESLDIFAESLLELDWSERWFEDERKVVLQEIEKVSERPWHRLWTAWDALAFTRHPYRRAVIGDAATVKAQTMLELHRYYRDRFVPNHLVLVVVGDFQPKVMLRRIEDRFAKYPKGITSFELPDVAEPEQRAARRSESEYAGTASVRFLLGFRTPGANHPDTPGLLLLAQLLNSPTEGLPAWLTRGKQWVISINAEHTFMVDYGHLVIQGEVEPENAAAVLAWLRGYVTGLGDRPFSALAVREAGRTLLTQRARDWEGFGDQAQGLGFWIERMGPEAAQRSTTQMLAQTPGSLAAIAGRYLKPERVVETVLKPPGTRFGPAKAVSSPRPAPTAPHLSAAVWNRPAAAPAWTFRKVGEQDGVVAYEMSSGLRLLVKASKASDLVSVVSWTAGGQWVEPADKAGVAVLTARLLISGTRNLVQAQWDRLLSSQAISVAAALRFGERAHSPRNVHARDGATLAFSGTRAQTPALIGMMGEALIRPVFPASEVAKGQRVLLTEIESLREDNLEFIKQRFYQHAFGKTHPYGRPTIGTADTVRALSQADVVAYHRSAYASDRVTVAVVGPVDPEGVAQLVATRWSDAPVRRAGPLPEPNQPLAHKQPHLRDEVVELGKDQWCVNVGAPTLAAADPRFAVAEVLTAIVRGRHFYKYVYELGVSYRSWIKLWAHRTSSVWILENDVARDGFEDTLKKMREDLTEYGTGRFLPIDVELARTRLINRSILDNQSNLLTAFQLARGVGLGRPFDHLSRRVRALEQVTLEAVNALARELFDEGVRYELILR